jgi:hypothetical protein
MEFVFPVHMVKRICLPFGRSTGVGALFLSCLLTPILSQAQSQVERARVDEIVGVNPLASDWTADPSYGGSLPGGVVKAPPSPGDPDLGEQWILKEAERHRAFSIGVGASYAATNNVALVREGELSDSYLLTQAGANWVPAIGKGFFGQVYGRYEWYQYDKYDVLDFDAINAGAGILWISTKVQGLSAYARYEFEQLRLPDGGEEFYTDHGIDAGVLKIFPLSRAHYWFVGAGGELSLDTDPEISQRHELKVHAGYNLQVTRWLKLDLIYQASGLFYPERDRNDFNQVAGASLTASPWQWAAIGVSGSYAFNRSEESVFDYDAGTVGVSLSATVFF